MTAQPLTPAWYQPKPPFTVDTLFDLPESDLRYEVLGGQLVVSAAPAPVHNLVLERIRSHIGDLVPKQAEIIANTAIRMPDGDGPIPDLLITTADVMTHERGLPAALVHTVMEVVSPSTQKHDRELKSAVYADGGIPCYWRIELRSWKHHFGPLPAIVVRLLSEGEIAEHLFAAGQVHDIPFVVGPRMELVTVQMDPADLVGPRK